MGSAGAGGATGPSSKGKPTLKRPAASAENIKNMKATYGTPECPDGTVFYRGGRIQVSFLKKAYRVHTPDGCEHKVNWGKFKSVPTEAFKQAVSMLEGGAKCHKRR